MDDKQQQIAELKAAQAEMEDALYNLQCEIDGLIEAEPSLLLTVFEVDPQEAYAIAARLGLELQVV